jgi:hypothetical protein
MTDERVSVSVTYPRDAVLTIRQVAEALGVSTRTIERIDLPTRKRTKRFIWGQVLDALAGKAA